MNQPFTGSIILVLKERFPLNLAGSCLAHQGLPQRMVTAYEEFVPCMQPGKQPCIGQPRELAVMASVAVFACEHKVPNAVQIRIRHLCLQYLWEEVVNVSQQRIAFEDTDPIEAVETSTFLVAVEGTPRGRDGDAAPGRPSVE